MPRNVADVQASVKCAYNAGIKVTVKSGGHSYGAYGLDGSMVIDMLEFQNVTVDSTTNIASVGAGIRLGNMASKLFALGGRALPHGTCPSVGVGGHATLGGFGLDSRLWGLLLDTVVSLDVVTANGTCTTVSATQYSDLFWALRGAGPGFAVVTTFHFQTFAAPSVNINWAYTYTIPSVSNAAAAFQYAANWALTAPKELGYGIELFPGNQFVIRGVYYGSQTTYQSIIAPLLTKLKSLNGGKGPTSSVQQLGWIDSLTALAGSSLTTPAAGDGSHDTFYVKSIDTDQSTSLPLAAYTGLFNYLYSTTAPNNSQWFIIVNLYGGTGSIITSFPPSTDPSSTSSYAGRNSGYVWQIYGYTSNSQPPFPNSIITFITGIVNSMGSSVANLPAYPAYADTQLTQSQAQTRYWGASVPRLKTIKAAWDPKGILYNPQGF
jgi:FAD/FMN-containing dehydrogenase